MCEKFMKKLTNIKHILIKQKSLKCTKAEDTEREENKSFKVIKCNVFFGQSVCLVVFFLNFLTENLSLKISDSSKFEKTVKVLQY